MANEKQNHGLGISLLAKRRNVKNDSAAKSAEGRVSGLWRGRAGPDSVRKDIIMSAVDTARDLLDTDSTARALEHIAYDWLMSSADLPELLPLETAKGLIERVYGVQLAIKSNEKNVSNCNKI